MSEVASELDVDVLVVGTVTRSRDKIRIAAHLVEARGDQNLWAETLSPADERSVFTAAGHRARYRRANPCEDPGYAPAHAAAAFAHRSLSLFHIAPREVMTKRKQQQSKLCSSMRRWQKPMSLSLR